VTNSGSGYIYRVTNDSGSSLTSSGDIAIVVNDSGATFSHNAGEVGNLYNSGVYNGTSGSVIGSVTNDSNFTNNGVINDDITNSGTFVNNQNVSLNGTSIYTYSDQLTNTSGASFTNNADISVSQEGHLNIDGSFSNNGNVSIQNADNTQYISGSFTNNAAATVNVIGSTVELNGSFTNKGDVSIDATSLLTGNGTYTQQGNNAPTTVVNGRVETDMMIKSGVLSGIGQIAGDLTVTAPGTLRPGLSPGQMTIEGDLNLSGLLDLEVVLNEETGLLEYDSLAIGGDLNVFGSGRVSFDLGEGLDETIFTGESPELALSDIFFGTNEESDPLDITALLATSLRIDLASGEAFNLLLVEDEFGTISTEVEAVPVPAAVWLFGSGLLGLVGLARRKV
jgi:hypothetical protein